MSADTEEEVKDCKEALTVFINRCNHVQLSPKKSDILLFSLQQQFISLVPNVS